MEYFFVYTPPPITYPSASANEFTQEAEHRKQAFEEFKAGQENAAKIWVAIVTVLAALYFGNPKEKG
jgi:hypothetical protein